LDERIEDLRGLKDNFMSAPYLKKQIAGEAFFDAFLDLISEIAMVAQNAKS
jgi:hypothetical protein